LSDNLRPELLQENRKLQEQLVASYRQRGGKLVSYDEACRHPFTTDWTRATIDRPTFLGKKVLRDFDLKQLIELIDWSPFFLAWEMKGKYPAILSDATYGPEARTLLDDARARLRDIVEKRLIQARAVYGFWPAGAVGDDVVLFHDESRSAPIARFHFLRQQWERPGQRDYRSLADYVAPIDSGRPDYLGAFVVTTGVGVDDLTARYEAAHDDYNSIMVKALADRLAEAFAEWLHRQARRDWGYGIREQLSNDELIDEKYRGIRPAPGYPACPDHTEKRTLFELLGAEQEIGVHLTESCAMFPAASVSGFYFAHPEARYFAVDRVTRDQVESYAARKQWPVRDVERWLAPNLGYDP
jgi:5-methyltetrahydrofolate--homocysteine methyltransferase